MPAGLQSRGGVEEINVLGKNLIREEEKERRSAEARWTEAAALEKEAGIAVREAAMLGCVPLTSTCAVFGDATKDYCVRVAGDPREASTQRAAADLAVELLRGYEATGQLPSVDTETLRSETWARVADRWLDVIDRL